VGRRLIKVGVLLLAVSVIFLVVYVASNYLKPSETMTGGTTTGKDGGIITIPSSKGGAQPTGSVTSVETGSSAGSSNTAEPTTGGGSVSIPDMSEFATFTLLSTFLGFVGGTLTGCFFGSRDTGVVSTPEKKPPKIDIKDMIVGCMVREGKFTVPGIAEAVRASEPQVEHVVKNLVQRGVVRSTEKVWPVASGSARVYEYMRAIK